MSSPLDFLYLKAVTGKIVRVTVFTHPFKHYSSKIDANDITEEDVEGKSELPLF